MGTDPALVTGALAFYSLFGLYVFSSISMAAIGVVVAFQWPNPRACCYRTSHSDLPSRDGCGCCALHRVNICFCVTWLGLLVLVALAFIRTKHQQYLLAAAGVLSVVHACIAWRLVRQLKASHAANAQLAAQLAVAVEVALPAAMVVTGLAVDRPLPGVPVPGRAVICIPMRVAVVEAQLATHLNYGQAQQQQQQQLGAGGSRSPRAAPPRAEAAEAAAQAAAGASGGGGHAAKEGAGAAVGAASRAGVAGAGADCGASGSGRAGVPVAAVVDGRLWQQQQQQQRRDQQQEQGDQGQRQREASLLRQQEQQPGTPRSPEQAAAQLGAAHTAGAVASGPRSALPGGAGPQGVGTPQAGLWPAALEAPPWATMSAVAEAAHGAGAGAAAGTTGAAVCTPTPVPGPAPPPAYAPAPGTL